MNILREYQNHSTIKLVSIFALVITGLNLLYARPAAASYQDNVYKEYKVYTKSGTNTVIANKSRTPFSPVWVLDYFLPQITTNGKACDSGNKVVPHNFDSKLQFNDCEGLTIQEAQSPAGNDAWFQDTNISYVVGDFDNAETIDIGRGYIAAYGASTSGNPYGAQRATAKKGASGCDNPNPDYSDRCSLLIYFSNGNNGDFHITLDNVFNNGKPSSGHEYWYRGPVVSQYRTLTFDPNGGTVIDNIAVADSNLLVRHSSGATALREYAKGKLAGTFPTPTKGGFTFLGWFDAGGLRIDGGSVKQAMDQDVTLYAHWAPIVGAYVLAPHVNSPVNAVRQGEMVTFTPSVTKDNSNDSNNTSWKFCRVLVAPGVAAPAAGSVCSNPDATVVESKDNEVFRGSGPFTIGNPANYVYTVPASTLYGSQICYALLVNSSTQEAGHPAESVKCVIIAKSPHLQVWGNDVRVGSSFLGWDDNDVSLMNASNGSWGEYGVIASGTISGLGSGSVANGTLLTFANKPTLGGFTQATSIEGLGAIPNVKKYLEKAGNAEYRGKTGIILADAPALIGSYAANTVYTTSGTVTISGDIINSSKGNNLSQMVIIADNINILPTVKQVDAWLIANDTINTCWVDGDVPKIGNCGDNTNASTLRINGPIMAGSLLLNRTGGSDTDDNSAAEIINLRGDAYIWMRKLSTETGSIRTVYTRELAPRY